MKCKRNIKNENFLIVQNIQKMNSSRNYIYMHNDVFRVLFFEKVQIKKKKNFVKIHVLTHRIDKTIKSYNENVFV